MGADGGALDEGAVMTDARYALPVLAPTSGRNPGLVERVFELNAALSDQTRTKQVGGQTRPRRYGMIRFAAHRVPPSRAERQP